MTVQYPVYLSPGRYPSPTTNLLPNFTKLVVRAKSHTSIDAISVYGILMSSLIRSFVVAMSARLKKLTIQVPEDLLARATAASGEGITPTVRRGLELMAASTAYAKLRRLRGKVKFGIKLDELRQD